MIRHIALGLGILAAGAFGGAAVDRLNAQNRAPGAYAMFDISEITNQDDYQAHLPNSAPSNDAFGGRFVIRTNTIIGRDGTPPKRFVVIAFDSMEKAIAWSNSPAQKELDQVRTQSSKGRSFIIDGAID